MQETLVGFLGGEDSLEKDRLPTPVFLGFPGGSAGKESTCSAADLGLVPGLRRSPGEGKGYPLQYSGLENPMDCIVHGVTKSQTQLSDFHSHSYLFWVMNFQMHTRCLQKNRNKSKIRWSWKRCSFIREPLRTIKLYLACEQKTILARR